MLPTAFSAVRLANVRRQQFLSQQSLAQRADLSVATVSRLERGLGTPRPSTIRKLAEALQVDRGELLQ